jgi:hypothetical protein
MNSFSIALFLHIVGALGVFVALSLEWTALRQVRSATLAEQVRPWMRILKSTNKVGLPSMLMTVVTGIYMVLDGLGWVPWILVVIGALVLVITLSVVLTKPRMMAIGQALAKERGPVSQSFQSLVNHPSLWISIQTRVAVALGIIFLKVTTPDFGGALLTIGVAIVLGIASALAMPHRAQAHEGPADIVS